MESPQTRTPKHIRIYTHTHRHRSKTSCHISRDGLDEPFHGRAACPTHCREASNGLLASTVLDRLPTIGNCTQKVFDAGLRSKAEDTSMPPTSLREKRSQGAPKCRNTNVHTEQCIDSFSVKVRGRQPPMPGETVVDQSRLAGMS